MSICPSGASDNVATLSPPSAPLGAASGNSYVFWGIVMCEVAVTFIALGANIQRYGLTQVSPERKLFGCFRCAQAWPWTKIAPRTHLPDTIAMPGIVLCVRSLINIVWFCGLMTYFLGNVVFFAALSLAPASLCAALLATVVIINAVIARVLLKERLQRCDWHGGGLICLGIGVAAAFAPYVTIEYDAREIAVLISDAYGALYIAFLVLLVLLLGGLVCYHEQSGHRPRGADVCIAGVPVPRTRPCLHASPQANHTFAAGVEMASAPSALADRARYVSFGGMAARGGSGGGGGGGGFGGRVCDLDVACTVIPDCTPAPSSPPSSPPPSPPTGPPTGLPSEVHVGVPALAASPALAPRLAEATTSVAGSRNSNRAPAPACSSDAAAGSASPESSPTALSAVGRGFAGGDPIAAVRRRKRFLDDVMPFAYPVVLGTLETLVQMCQKAASSMAFLTLSGESQVCHPIFWGSWLLLSGLTVFVIWWLRKGLSHLEASRLLPVECAPLLTSLARVPSCLLTSLARVPSCVLSSLGHVP